MKILSNKQLKNGSSIHGECVMINKDGSVYPCIDNLYHPNPGTAETEYDEIERTIDWLYMHSINSIKSELNRWVAVRVAKILEEDPEASLDEVLLNVMYCDSYDPCQATKDAVGSAYVNCKDSEILNRYLQYDELNIAKKIVDFLNERFLRVRAGGKLNPEGSDSIYFRISSHDYNWRSVIEDFLWDTFKSIDQMPKYIWIGHDAETNPPEITLFEGTPQDLINDFDSSIFASDDIIWI